MRLNILQILLFTKWESISLIQQNTWKCFIYYEHMWQQPPCQRTPLLQGPQPLSAVLGKQALPERT